MTPTSDEMAPWLCRTCAWGFPESLGYSCSHLEGHVCSHVVVACEEYRRQHELVRCGECIHFERCPMRKGDGSGYCWQAKREEVVRHAKDD